MFKHRNLPEEEHPGRLVWVPKKHGSQATFKKPPEKYPDPEIRNASSDDGRQIKNSRSFVIHLVGRKAGFAEVLFRTNLEFTVLLAINGA